MFAFFKIFPYLMPFLKEMILGKKTWKEGFRDNKKKTIFAVLVMCSFALNFALVPKLAMLATRYIALNREYGDYRTTHPDPIGSTQKHPVESGKEVTADIKQPKERAVKATPVPVPRQSSAEDIQAEFNRMRAREAAEHQ